MGSETRAADETSQSLQFMLKGWGRGKRERCVGRERPSPWMILVLRDRRKTSFHFPTSVKPIPVLPFMPTFSDFLQIILPTKNTISHK